MGRYEAVLGRSRLVIDARSSVHPIHVETPVDAFLDAEFDEGGIVVAAPVDGEVSVAVADLRSGNPVIDRETRRRLDVRRHPRIVGRLSALTPTATAGMYGAEGELEFFGSTRSVSGAVAMRVDGDEVSAEGQQRFDVRDWGLQPPQLLMLRVHPLVAVSLRLVLRRVG